ncbi:MAG: amidohydrolase [Bryobacteraceae bacterium]
MRKAALFLALTGMVVAESTEDLPAIVNGELPSLVEIYKGIHEHPELSHQETQTSAKLAEELRKAGYTVTENVGKYENGAQAHGVVAILKNGPGPQLLIRADMDALPIVEETGVDYASQVKGVMHACGHDIHTTTLIGVGRALAAMKNEWHGTLMLIGQPSEETIDGARAMLADGLYERFGTPTYAIALHDSTLEAAGTVGLTTGAATTSATSIDVTIRGVGGHGAFPQMTKDPIVMAAEFIMQLQTIVSRQENPNDPSILTVGDIHGGTRRNIIPNEVKLELTARTFSEQSREIILDGVHRTARGVGIAAGVPEDRMPVVTVLENESCPMLYNDPALMTRVRAALTKAIGSQNVFDAPPVMASEDFPFLGLGRKIPTVMFWLGAANPAKYAAAKAAGTTLPGPHTNKFQPDPEPTLRTGVIGMTSAAIALLQN